MKDLQELESELNEIGDRISALSREQTALKARIRQEKVLLAKDQLDELVRLVFALVPNLKYAAMDRTGRILFYSLKPQFTEGDWKGNPLKLASSGSRYQITTFEAPASTEDLRMFFWERDNL